MMEHFEIGEVIGRGAVGVVHRGRQLRPARPVAIKVLKEELAEDETVRRRFLDEANYCAWLNQHPGIVTVFVVIGDERPAIVMELLEGETLRKRLQRGTLPPAEATRIAVEILDALQYAHSYHEGAIVHRDIKPSNIFLCRGDGASDHVKLTDFGIAKVAGAAAITKIGTPLGSFQYTSPEQIKGSADARSDVYSVGIVLYEMLAGPPPFQFDETVALINAQLKQKPPPLPETIPLHLRRAVDKALAKNPDHRFQSAAEFAAALQPPVATASKSEHKLVNWLATAALVGVLTAMAWAYRAQSPEQTAQEKVQPGVATQELTKIPTAPLETASPESENQERADDAFKSGKKSTVIIPSQERPVIRDETPGRDSQLSSTSGKKPPPRTRKRRSRKATNKVVVREPVVVSKPLVAGEPRPRRDRRQERTKFRPRVRRTDNYKPVEEAPLPVPPPPPD